MKKSINPFIWLAISTLIGGAVGYGYYHFYGCTNGCSITGSPVNSTLYFAFLGALIPGMFKKQKNKFHD